MSRLKALKRHIQLELLTRDGTRAKTKRAANKRRNRGGRPPRGPRSSERHEQRERFRRLVPAHVNLRVEKAIGYLRTPEIYLAVRRASDVVSKRADFHIVHISIQATHLHLLVEALNHVALAKGMQAFQISAAKHINRAITPAGERRRRGRVFSDRYHVELITNPRQAHRALGYVLNNWRKHGEDQFGEARTWQVDPYSTAMRFDGWKERQGKGPWKPRRGYLPLVVSPPATWLLNKGWRMYGLISLDHIPSAPIVRT